MAHTAIIPTNPNTGIQCNYSTYPYQSTSSYHTGWSNSQKILFRFFFIYFTIQILPLDWKFYKQLFSINWLHLHFRELLELTRYMPAFFSSDALPEYGIGSFANWAVFAFIAAVGATVWTYKDKERKEYNDLYYWLRVIIRYRLAIGVIAYGLYKLFPIQMPYPSLSNLNTNYGDFFSWKIYFQTLGIAPKYESFLGFVEILAGFLLFHRKTTTIGAGILIGFFGNVAVANGFYDMGEHVYSSFLVLMALFLIVYDVPRLWRLLVLEKKTLASRFVPDFSNVQLRKLRTILRAGFLIFVFLFGAKTYADYNKGGGYLVPQTPGLKDAFGYYNVREFRLNNKIIPYSTTDPNRWQDVIFEKWSTLSIKVNRPVIIDRSNGNDLHEKDIDRNYELAGLAGRHYFFYEADTTSNQLALQNKNKHHRNEKMSLQFQRPSANTIILSGTNELNDSIYVVLEKVDKKYMMFEGRRRQVKI